MSGRRVSSLVVLACSSLALVGVGVAGPAAQAAPAPAAVRNAVGADSVSDRVRRQEASERASRVSRSLYGVRPSAYVGPYFNARDERTRMCIVRRESGGNYRIMSAGGTYRGAYQFNQALGDYAARLMKRPDLVGRGVHTWSRFEQDKAFWIIWNHGRGASHWGGGRWHC